MVDSFSLHLLIALALQPYLTQGSTCPSPCTDVLLAKVTRGLLLAISREPWSFSISLDLSENWSLLTLSSLGLPWFL